jgi:transposase-like protein
MTCRCFGVPRWLFYVWRDAYQEHGEEGLRRKKPVARSHPNQTPDEIVDKSDVDLKKKLAEWEQFYNLA